MWCHGKNTVWNLGSRQLYDLLLCDLGKEHNFSWFTEKIETIFRKEVPPAPISNYTNVSIILCSCHDGWARHALQASFSSAPWALSGLAKDLSFAVIFSPFCIIMFPLLTALSSYKITVIFPTSPKALPLSQNRLKLLPNIYVLLYRRTPRTRCTFTVLTFPLPCTHSN